MRYHVCTLVPASVDRKSAVESSFVNVQRTVRVSHCIIQYRISQSDTDERFCMEAPA